MNYRETYRKELLETAYAVLSAPFKARYEDEALVQLFLENVGLLLRLKEPLPPWCSPWLARIPKSVMNAITERYRYVLEELEPDEAWQDEIKSAFTAILEWGKSP